MAAECHRDPAGSEHHREHQSGNECDDRHHRGYGQCHASCGTAAAPSSTDSSARNEKMKKLIVLLWMGLGTPAYAALVQSTGLQCADAATTQPFSFATLPVVNNYVFVFSSRYAPGTGTLSVTDNQSNSYTNAIQNGNASTNETIAYAKVTTSSGTFTITLSMVGSASGNYYCSDAIEWNNISAATPFDVSTSNSGSGMSQNTGTTGATAQANELVLVCLSGDGGNPMNI